MPTPWEIRPPTPFALKEVTAKPIIWAQQPTAAAPAAIPSRPSMIAIAADDIGAVRASPISTETVIPIGKG